MGDLSNYMYMGMIFSFVLLLFAIYNTLGNNTQSEQPKEKEKKKTKSDQADDVLNTLNWMLDKNIITQQEYNQLIVKVSGYL